MSQVFAKRCVYTNRELHEQLIIKIGKVVNHMALDNKTKACLGTLKWLDQVQFVEFVLDVSESDTH